MKWEQGDTKYYQRADGFAICVWRDREPLYELWDTRERPHIRLGAYRSAEDARRAAREACSARRR